MNEKRIVTTNIIYKEAHDHALEILKKINWQYKNQIIYKQKKKNENKIENEI